MSLGASGQKLVGEIKTIMEEFGSMRMTIRQIYYQLVSRHIIPNNLNAYKNYDRIITRAREEDLIDSYKISDTSKPVLIWKSWDSLADYLDSVKYGYNKTKWTEQEQYVEIWLEKDALRGVFENTVSRYDVPLVIGRGYQSHTNLVRAKDRIRERMDEGKSVHIVYFGDFDPTGLDIPRQIKDKLESMGLEFDFHRVAITPEQIAQYQIPPIPTKKSDSRAGKFIKEHGDQAVELDALNPKVLQELLENSIKAYLDEDLFEETLAKENKDEEKLREIIKELESKGDKK